MCVLKALRLRDQHACLLASLTTSPLRQTACIFVLKQALHLVFPPGSSGKKSWILCDWTSKTKCREVDGTTERKDQAFNFVLLVYFIFLRLPGLSHQSLGVFSSCEFLGLLLWRSDRPLPQKSERVKQCSEWIREVCRALNAQPLGWRARVKTHIAGAAQFHQSLSYLKQRASPHAMYMKGPPLWNGFKKAKKVVWIVFWQFNHLKMYVTLFCKMHDALFRGTMKHKSV